MNWLLPVTGAVFFAALFARIFFEDRRARARIAADHEDFCARVRARGSETECKVYRFPRPAGDFPRAA